MRHSIFRQKEGDINHHSDRTQVIFVVIHNHRDSTDHGGEEIDFSLLDPGVISRDSSRSTDLDHRVKTAWINLILKNANFQTWQPQESQANLLCKEKKIEEANKAE